MIEPISPDQVSVEKMKYFPNCVIKAFNDLIIREWDGQEARFRQSEVIEKIIQLGSMEYPKLTSQDICEKKWLDVEEVYREKGWIVEFEKGDWNSSDPSIFTFKKKKKMKRPMVGIA